MEKNLTQGSIKKLYFRYLGAAFGSAMISCIYGMVDVAVVGQYQGPQGTAALSVVAPIWTILYSLGILTGSGGSIKYTYYRAQGKTDKANAYFTLSLLLTSVIAVVCWIGLTVFDDQLLRLFGADEALLPLAEAYLRPMYCCSDGSKGGCYPRICYCRHAFQCDCHDVFHLSFVQKQRTDWQDIKKNR